MNKRVLIISGSPRKGGNSDLLCDEFLRGAAEAGNQVEKIFLREKEIHYCNACARCRENGGNCIIADDMAEIQEKMKIADVIVMASPVYFYSIDAQMKTLIDRIFASCLYIRNKEMYFIMTSAADTDTVMDCTLECFRGFASCLENAKEMGVIYGKGVHDAGDIRNHPAMKQAYEMGKMV